MTENEAREAKSTTEALRLCKVCGEPIRVGKAEFCSESCRRIHRLRPRWRNCASCRTLFFAENGRRLCDTCRARGVSSRPKRIKPGAPFEAFLAAQRAARAQGKNLTYGEWQQERYKGE